MRRLLITGGIAFMLALSMTMPMAVWAKGPGETTVAAAEEIMGRLKSSVEHYSEMQIQKPAYSEEDLYILAHVICGEAQGYPDDEQLYVGSVVLNRMNHTGFPSTIKGVVFAPGQYSCTRDGNYNRQPTDRNWANAQWLLENGSVLPGNVIWQSGGRQGNGVYLRTRYHSYCY